MLGQFLVGSAASICNIAIHAFVTAVVVWVANAMAGKSTSWPFFLLICTMIATVLVLMAAHTLEVMVWAFVYLLTDTAPAGAGLVYFAFTNYTTLGYGDILPVERWQLLGPFAAMNGVLLFGWSTAVIFEALRRTVARASQAEAVP